MEEKKLIISEPTKQTIGSIASDLMIKTPESTDPIEIEKEMQKEYLNELLACISSWKSKFNKSFFVVVITKNEKLLPNVFRNYFIPRLSCPTPDYDQAVFRYNFKDECVEYVWSIPSKDTCLYLINNALQVHESERQLLNFVLDFASGKLYETAKKLNGEQATTSELIK